MRRGQIHLVVLAILLIGMIAYAGTGVVYSGALVGNAERTLDAVVSHQNSLNTSFNAIGDEVTALSGTFNPDKEIALADQSVAHSQLALRTINQDDVSLASTQGQLQGSRWLTMINHGSVDREAARVAHARNALAAARTIAADQVLDGAFWHSLYMSIYDLDQLTTQVGAGDLTTARATVTSMQAPLDQTARQSKSPGLPDDLQTFITDMRTFVTDYGKLLDAEMAGDDSGVTQYQSAVVSDQEKLASHDFDKIGTEIDAYFKPLIDRFNSEITAATS